MLEIKNTERLWDMRRIHISENPNDYVLRVPMKGVDKNLKYYDDTVSIILGRIPMDGYGRIYPMKMDTINGNVISIKVEIDTIRDVNKFINVIYKMVGEWIR